MNSAVLPSNSAKVRTKNSASGTKNMNTNTARAGSISSSVRSLGAVRAAEETGPSVATASVMACPLCLGGEDQAVRYRPAQHDRHADRQRCDTGGVLQIDDDRRAALDLYRIAQDVAEKRAAAD